MPAALARLRRGPIHHRRHGTPPSSWHTSVVAHRRPGILESTWWSPPGFHLEAHDAGIVPHLYSTWKPTMSMISDSVGSNAERSTTRVQGGCSYRRAESARDGQTVVCMSMYPRRPGSVVSGHSKSVESLFSTTLLAGRGGQVRFDGSRGLVHGAGEHLAEPAEHAPRRGLLPHRLAGGQRCVADPPHG